MKRADWITLAVLASLLFAIFMGRRAGKRQQAAALAAARAEGFAEATALSASVSQSGVYIGSPGAGNLSTDSSAIEQVVRAILAENRTPLYYDNDNDRRPASNILDGRTLPDPLGIGPSSGLGSLQDSARNDTSKTRDNGAVVAYRRHRGSVRDIRTASAEEVDGADPN